MKTEEIAKELCYRFYFGWMKGYNDLAKSLGMPEVSSEAVKKKADASVDQFMADAEEIVKKS